MDERSMDERAMSARLTAKIEVSALIRRVAAAGGHAMLLRRGDPDAGAILLQLADRGVFAGFLERVLGPDGHYGWRANGPKPPISSEELAGFLERRVRVDPDLWIVELDIAGVERFADEMMRAN